MERAVGLWRGGGMNINATLLRPDVCESCSAIVTATVGYRKIEST